MKRRPSKPQRRVTRSKDVALLLIDNAPLHEAAWDRLLRARKRLERATADLHRHEQTDEPAYRIWVHTALPALVSQIRELSSECESKRVLIEDVRRQAFRRGTTPAVIWQLRKDQARMADAFSADDLDDDPFLDDDDEFDGGPPSFEDMVNEILEASGLDPDSPEAEMVRDSVAFSRGDEHPEHGEAREIYRRLVQRLHPDRGGEWTPERERLWHEVQRAWNERDVDWLSRLEAEFDVVSETLGVHSSVGRLYNAVAEIEAARRDADRKLRFYRKSPAWRFTLVERTPKDMRDLESDLQEQRDFLRRTLEQLTAMIAQWEKPLGVSRAKKRVRRDDPEQAAQLNLL